MFLLTHSREILYIVLAFSVLWISVFLIWFVYYLIATIRDFRKAAQGAKNIVKKIDAIVDLIKKKVETHANYLSMIIEGVKKVKDAVQSEDPTKPVKKAKKTAKK
ncbi:MAG: hypothetical protein V1865_01980 [bacterium]